jgi:hypothetical protein
MKKVAVVTLFSTLLGCSALTGMATDAILGSSTDGMEVTAQVGKNNNKGMVATSVDTSQDIDIDEVKGNATIGSGNTYKNSSLGMIGLVLAGMLPPMLLLFYLLPNPRWLARRYKDTPD